MPIGRKPIEQTKIQEDKSQIEYREVNGKKIRVVYETDDELYHVKSFVDKYERGKLGKNKSIPTGFKRFNRYVPLRRQMYYLIGGFTGSAKTTFLDDAFVLNPAEWFMAHPDSGVDLHIEYFSMERSKDFKIAKWVARKIFLETGVIITLDEILGISTLPTIAQQTLIDRYLPSINKLFDSIITLHENPINPFGFWKKVKELALSRGHEEEIIVVRKNGTEYEKTIYVPNNPDEVVLIVMDTINLSKPEGKFVLDEMTQKRRTIGLMSPKETLDKMSEYLRKARDYFGYSPVVVSQFNRSIANPIRLKNGDVSPNLEDFSGTSETQNDAEAVIALFDPMRYKVDDVYGYKLHQLKEGAEDAYPGSKKYRAVSILKNSYGADDVGVGIALQPQVGIVKELPYPNEMTDDMYKAVLNNDFFRW